MARHPDKGRVSARSGEQGSVKAASLCQAEQVGQDLCGEGAKGNGQFAVRKVALTSAFKCSRIETWQVTSLALKTR